MKKLSLIFIISLTLSVNSYAKIFELHQCYPTHKLGKLKYKDWKEYSEKNYYEDFIFSVDTKEKKVTQLLIITNTKKYLKKKQELWEQKKDFSVNTLQMTVEFYEREFPYPLGVTKYDKEIYKLTDFSAGIATAKIQEMVNVNIGYSGSYLNININNGEIEEYADHNISDGKTSEKIKLSLTNYKCKKK